MVDKIQTHQKWNRSSHKPAEEAFWQQHLEGVIENHEEWFHALAKLSPVGIFRTDAEGRCLYVNERWCEIAGLTPREALGEGWTKALHPDDREHIFAEWSRTAREKLPFELEYRFQRPDGAVTWVFGQATAEIGNGEEIAGYVGTITDITRRKRADETLKTRTYDLNERVKELNCLYNISKLREKPGISFPDLIQGIIDLIPPAWQYPEITCAGATLEGKRYLTENFNATKWKQSCRIFTHGEPAGTLEVYYLEEKSESFEGPFLKEERHLIDAVAERLGRIFVTNRAETALRKAHDDLERRVEERTADLARANENLNREIEERKRAEVALRKSSEKIKLFACSVSHDLKSPAIGIHGLTRLLHRHIGELLDDKGRDYCDLIMNTAENIAGLAEKINVFISTKEAPLCIEKVDLKELFRTVREEFSPKLDLRRIKWLEPECPPGIRADVLSILRVMRNLVDNALKYGGDDLSEIQIGYEESDDAHVLFVRDDGIGIKKEDSENVFTLFERNSTSAGIEGTGLGLAIVKEIGERHGGQVWAEPGPDNGTTFYLSISKEL